jgi:hypothetical protein
LVGLGLLVKFGRRVKVSKLHFRTKTSKLGFQVGTLINIDVLIALEAAGFEVRVEALRIRAADLCV